MFVPMESPHKLFEVGVLLVLALLAACQREAPPARSDATKVSVVETAASAATPPASDASVVAASTVTPPPSGTSAAASSETRKRHRAGPPVKLPGPEPGLPGGSVNFNPAAPAPATGSILIAPDDRCYYETIQGAPSNSPVDPWRKIYVDCPSALDDPAFDSCTDGRLQGARGAPRCLCTDGSGRGSAAPCPK